MSGITDLDSLQSSTVPTAMHCRFFRDAKPQKGQRAAEATSNKLDCGRQEGGGSSNKELDFRSWHCGRQAN